MQSILVNPICVSYTMLQINLSQLWHGAQSSQSSHQVIFTAAERVNESEDILLRRLEQTQSIGPLGSMQNHILSAVIEGNSMTGWW